MADDVVRRAQRIVDEHRASMTHPAAEVVRQRNFAQPSKYNQVLSRWRWTGISITCVAAFTVVAATSRQSHTWTEALAVLSPCAYAEVIGRIRAGRYR